MVIDEFLSESDGAFRRRFGERLATRDRPAARSGGDGPAVNPGGIRHGWFCYKVSMELRHDSSG